jgi:hypothetical protein
MNLTPLRAFGMFGSRRDELGEQGRTEHRNAGNTGTQEHGTEKEMSSRNEYENVPAPAIRSSHSPCSGACCADRYRGPGQAIINHILLTRDFFAACATFAFPVRLRRSLSRGVWCGLKDPRRFQQELWTRCLVSDIECIVPVQSSCSLRPDL